MNVHLASKFKRKFGGVKVKQAVKKYVSKSLRRLGELKLNQLANTVAGTPVAQASTNPNSNLIPQITAGQAANQRIGNKIAIKEIVLQGQVNWPTPESVGSVRFVIFVDNDCTTGSSTGANWGAVFPVVTAGNEHLALQGSATMQRFRILRDFWIRPKNPVNMAVTTQGQQEFKKRIRFKKGFLQKYTDNTNNNVVNRSIYYMVAGDLAAGAGLQQPSLRLEGHTKYKDI